ncbi:MAG: RnfABCDGE type electron transport complex subunit B [Desulfobacterales bacterium]|nr:RnfABCDGE type electron transport complex subunit B [Desulfobacterales bacterium]
MVDAVIIMGGLGLIIGAGLAVASKVFYVYVDPLIVAVEDALPGANCGGCGLPGCGANAEAIVAGKASPNSCVAGGPDTVAAVAAVLGVSVEAKEPDIARPGCYYGVQDADLKYEYDGLSDCRAVALLGGGMKVCTIGCLGLGTCAKACPFNAISMWPENLPIVDAGRCTGCGTCERVCPKHIINLSSVTRRIMREYTTEECTTPCQRSCPAGIDIREYIRQIARGDFHRAVQVIKERNPFPAVIGRICPRPCEQDCRRQLLDTPVAINFLKRFAADFERSIGQRIQPYQAPATGKQIAVVGGGVEGLSAAFFSARLGHSPTVFEADARLGGVLKSAITSDRLPQDVLDWDIEGILDMGVTAHTHKTLGRDFTIPTLFKEGFEAVLVATGGWDSRLARTPRPEVEAALPGTYLLIDLLNAEKTGDPVQCGPQVVIAGGGKGALAAAQACRRLGAQEVTLLFRERWEESPFTDVDVEKFGAEGLRFVFQAGIERLFGEDQRLTGLAYIELGTSARQHLPVDTLVISAGRFPELIFHRLRDEGGAEDALEKDGALRWQAVGPFKPPAHYKERGLLSAGDPQTDFSAAIRAIGAGRRAAVSIHQLLYDLSLALPDTVITPEAYVQNVDRVEDVRATPRQVMPLCREQDADPCEELEKGFTHAMAQTEAARCLRCGLVCYEHTALAIQETAPAPGA